MHLVLLQMLRSNYAQRAPQAWLLPGSDAQAWLGELAGWQVPLGDVQLLPLPRGAADRSPLGALAIVPQMPPGRISGCCLPYGLAAANFYLPLEATLEPAASAAELATLLVAARIYVWHPIAGLTAFEPAQVLRIADLIRLGNPRETDWGHAQLGVILPSRLVSLVPETSLSLEEVLSEAQDVIGTEPISLEALPPYPGESPVGRWLDSLQGIGRSWSFLQRAFARLISWIIRRLPSNSPTRTWVNDVYDWTQRKLRQPRGDLSASQSRELSRLLHLLDKNPDEGLRYAIPFGQVGAPRGTAPPGGQLDRRDVNFDLRRLGGGQAVSYWNTAHDVQQELARRYRLLANREVSLGRHRRAAYIYAELLGDLPGAASVLAAGQHWREAAVLYRDRLRRNDEAARCLEQGGLFAEAIELYQQLQQYEKAGDLHGRLVQHDAARALYRQQVDRFTSAGEPVSASRVLDEKLHESDEALTILWQAWPQSVQAGESLRRAFALSGRLGRNDTALAKVSELADSPRIVGTARLPDILVELARSYPHDGVRQSAADATRRVVVRWWGDGLESDRQQLLQSIRELAPEDRLLTRDCLRFGEQQRPPEAKRVAKPSAKVRQATLLRRLQLDRNVEWHEATIGGQAIFAAGVLDRRACLQRIDWEGQTPHSLHIWPTVKSDPKRVILAADPQCGTRVIVHVIGGPALQTERAFPESEMLSFKSIVRAPTGATEGLVAAAVTPQGNVWLLDFRNDGLVLNCENRDGKIVQSQSVPFTEAMWDLAPLPIPMHVRTNRVFVGLGTALISLGEIGGPRTIYESETPIASLAGSVLNTRARVAAGTQRGAVLHWDAHAETTTTVLSEQLVTPQVGFNLNGYLIVADHSRADIYATQNRRAELIGQCSGWNTRPIGILRSPSVTEFGIATEKGEIFVFELK